MRFDVFHGRLPLVHIYACTIFLNKKTLRVKKSVRFVLGTQAGIATGSFVEWNDFKEIIYITWSRLLLHTKMAVAATFPGDKHRVFSRDSLF